MHTCVTHVHQKTFTKMFITTAKKMFITALFEVAPKWKLHRCSAVGRIVWYIRTAPRVRDLSANKQQCE